MSEFKVGDRVEVIGGSYNSDINVGDRGTIIADIGCLMGVDFDIDIGGHSCSGRGRYGHCWRVSTDYLKKIEETKEESKVDTMEQKILTALREEIGVEIGEEFYVYENGEKQWTCRFDEIGFSREVDDEFKKSGVWKGIVCKFRKYTFKRKPFIPADGEDYFSLAIRYDKNKNISFTGLHNKWTAHIVDYGMLALENVFRSEKEAFENEEKLLEKLEKLRRGE